MYSHSIRKFLFCIQSSYFCNHAQNQKISPKKLCISSYNPEKICNFAFYRMKVEMQMHRRSLNQQKREIK